MKYNLGDTVYFVYSSANYEKSIPCPVCFGKKFVKITFGNGEEFDTICGYCSHDFEGPTGIAKTWEPFAEIRTEVITGISMKNGLRYETNYGTFSEDELFPSKDLAQVVYEKEFNERKSQAEKWFKDSFVQCKAKQLWSAGYHKRCIESAEKTIEWHKQRLVLIKDKPK